MARIDTLGHFLTDVADAIREKTGSSDTIAAEDFDTEIENIPSGDLDWSVLGYNSTPQSIINDYNFSLQIQEEWEPAVSLENKFKFNSNIVYMPFVNTSITTSFNSMFYGCRDLAAVASFDTSNGANLNYMFYQCQKLPEIPPLNTSNATSMQYMCGDNPKLITIPAFDCSKITTIGGVVWNSTNLVNVGGFLNLGKAYNISTSAGAGVYTLQFYSDKLTHESLMNVINGLYDIKTKGCNPQKLILGSTNLAKLTSEEIAIATNKGWNVE